MIFSLDILKQFKHKMSQTILAILQVFRKFNLPADVQKTILSTDAGYTTDVTKHLLYIDSLKEDTFPFIHNPSLLNNESSLVYAINTNNLVLAKMYTGNVTIEHLNLLMDKQDTEMWNLISPRLANIFSVLSSMQV